MVSGSGSCEGCGGTGVSFAHAHDCFVRRVRRARHGQLFETFRLFTVAGSQVILVATLMTRLCEVRVVRAAGRVLGHCGQ